MWFDIIGTLDPKGLLLSTSKQELVRKRIKTCEMLSQECELQSQKVSDWDRGPYPCFSPGLSTPGSGETWLSCSHPSTSI